MKSWLRTRLGEDRLIDLTLLHYWTTLKSFEIDFNLCLFYFACYSFFLNLRLRGWKTKYLEIVPLKKKSWIPALQRQEQHVITEKPYASSPSPMTILYNGSLYELSTKAPSPPPPLHKKPRKRGNKRGCTSNRIVNNSRPRAHFCC